MILIIFINKGYNILSYNVSNAFLYSKINIELYIRLLIYIYNKTKYKNKVAKLNKALYSFK